MSSPTRKITATLQVLLVAGAVTSAVQANERFMQAFGQAVDRSPTNASTLVLKKHTFKDPGMRNMPSHTMLVPRDWRAEGQAFWPHQNFYSILPSQDIKVTSPDGLSVYIGPSISAVDYRLSPVGQQYGMQLPPEGASDSGRIVFRRPDSLQEWAQLLETKSLPDTYPKASQIRVTNVVVLPELTEMLNRRLAPLRQQTEMMNTSIGTRSTIEASYLGVEFQMVENGQTMEGIFMFGTMAFVSETEMMRQTLWSIDRNCMFRAPQGRLESSMPTLMTVANSLRQTPQWMQMFASHARKMNQISARGAAEISRINAESHREITRIINEGYQRRNQINDETHRKYINSLREVEDFVDSDGDHVQLPSGYDRVYSDGMGNYILTNDANFEPNVELEGTRDWNPIRSRG